MERLFQSTPSWRGRPFVPFQWYHTSGISIHAFVKMATAPIVDLFSASLFQSTPSWRGRLFFRYLCWWNVPFQSTPSWRGRLFCLLFEFNISFNFNPRPREEGDKPASVWMRTTTSFQSTPSWRGRPFAFVPYQVQNYISIHALVKRAT